MGIKSIDEDVVNVLKKVGLEDYEIDNVFFRNKYLEKVIDEDIKEIVKYLYTNCKLEMEDIKKLILKNPLILNESFSRIDALEEIYKTIGIENEKYRDFVKQFDKALSLNPKELADSVSYLQKSGYDNTKIADMLCQNPYLVINV